MHLTHMDLVIIQGKKVHPIQQHLKTFLMEKVARVIYIIIALFFCVRMFLLKEHLMKLNTLLMNLL